MQHVYVAQITEQKKKSADLSPSHYVNSVTPSRAHTNFVRGDSLISFVIE